MQCLNKVKETTVDVELNVKWKMLSDQTNQALQMCKGLVSAAVAHAKDV